MTNIRVEKVGDELHLFFKGHASKPDNDDINRACAALSMLAQTFQYKCLKADDMGELESYRCTEGDGELEIFVKPHKELERNFSAWLEFVKTGALLTEKSYPGSVRILDTTL